MPHKSFHVPLRSSSINPEPRPAEDVMNRSSRNDHKTRSFNKAQKLLGSADLPVDHDYHRQTDRRASRSAGHLHAPNAHRHDDTNDSLLPLGLRPQSSSPVLGQDHKDASESATPFAQLSRKLHLPGSDLYRFSSREPMPEPNRDNGAADHWQQHDAGFNPAFKQPKGPMKDNKRKTRPPRIDLSLLFPKPQAKSEPLLSPQRLTSSPSSISFTSEITTENVLKPHKSESRLTGKRLTKLRPRALSRPEHSQQNIDGVIGSMSPPPATPSWNNASLERTVRTTDMDNALVKNLNGQPTPRSPDRALYSQMNFSLRGRDHLQPNDANSYAPARPEQSPNSSQRTLRDTAKDRPNHESARFQSGLHEDKPRNQSAPPSKKSSKSTFKNSDLNTSSVLCLSSSDDEDEYLQPYKAPFRQSKNKRDSASTYGGYEAEICTAAAAHTIRGTLKSVERPSSSTTQRSRSSSKHLEPPLMPNNTRSTRSSGIPTILEPAFLHSDPMSDPKRAPKRQPSLSQKELHRRSRVMAVTRKEERFLESIRQREGKITPSIFNESLDPDRRSVISTRSGPNRDSYYRPGTSFLRLSGSMPAASARTSQATVQQPIHQSGTWTPQDTSDSEEKLSKSVPSPQASLASSKSFPSPATSATSPITPTLPIHRFSPLPSQKPPPSLPPPPVPDLQRNHSRRRTDSSGAIVLEDTAERPAENGEYPVWALGWSNDNNNLTAVH